MFDFNVIFRFSKLTKSLILFSYDIIALFSSIFLAFILASNFSNFNNTKIILFVISIIATFKFIFLFLFRIYSFMWRYASTNEFLALVKALLVSTFFLYLFFTFITNIKINFLTFFVDFFIGLSLISLLRLFLRYLQNNYRQQGNLSQKKRVLIIGAGEIASKLAKEMLNFYADAYEILGYLDDDLNKHKQLMYHKQILGPIKELNIWAKQLSCDEIIIAIPSLKNDVFNEIVSACKATQIPFRTTPSLHGFIEGKGITNQLKNVEIEDLLLRSEIKMDIEFIRSFYSNKTILVTGAAGSIGSEICRQLYKFDNCKLIFLDHNENGLFFLEQSLKKRKLNPAIFYVADIKDSNILAHIFKTYTPDLILHAAAHKHVPLMETNPYAAIQNNILGTQNLIECAGQFNCGHFILISTDKAVRPSSCMGASKRICEMLLQIYADKFPKTCFSAVRFGNVLGSNGSVIPLFKKQILAGGPLTITDPEMTRYFMTIAEAVSLVLQTGPIASSKNIFVLDMGKPVKIIDLAKEMIRLSGLILDRDIKLKIVGKRPGEKLHEELFFDKSLCKETVREKIFVKNHYDFEYSTMHKLILEVISLKKDLHPFSLKKALLKITHTN